MKFKKAYILKDLEEQPQQRWHAKPRYPCKRLKGQHSLKIFKTTPLRWWKPEKNMVEKRCVACGKKTITFE